MVEKILQGYMEKLHSQIRDEIREFVQYSLEPEDGTTNDYFLSLSINTKKPKQYKIEVDDEEIKITDVSSSKGNKIDENELVKALEEVAKKYRKLCTSAEIPPINPATKKLLEIAKGIRKEFPEDIRWLTKIEQPGKEVFLIFPRNLEEIQKENPQGRCKIEFTWKNKVLLNTYEGVNNDDTKKENWELFGEKLEATKTLIKFLEELLKELEN